ncbi:hypothetical protein AAVH_25623 [Aphelenchoides avenae]|nr:hypothetical protein AAVH_25623 [Aphelenchus avenae]
MVLALIGIAIMYALLALQIALYAVWILTIVVLIYLIYAKDKTPNLYFTYIWNVTSENLADSLKTAAKTTEQLAETAKDIQEAAKDFANIGSEIPRAFNVTVEFSPSDGVIDFITFRYVPLIAFALFVMTVAVLYFVYRSYIKWKREFYSKVLASTDLLCWMFRREELQTVIRLYEYERDANQLGTPEGFVESLAKGFEGKTRRRQEGALLDV